MGFPCKGNLQMKKHSFLSFSVSASFSFTFNLVPFQLHVCVCACLVVSDSFHNPMDPSLPGSSVSEIILVRILEWVAISFSRD